MDTQLSKIRLVGDKVLIQLFPYESETKSSTGLTVMNWAIEESESGRPKAVINDKHKYQDRGTVIQVAPKAALTMEESHPGVVPGAIVWINRAANSPHFQFLADKESPVQGFTGLVALQTGHIEAVEI